MLVDLTDKVAIVTGSTRGIGLATAIRLAAAGAHVVVNGRNDVQELTDAAEVVRRSAKRQVVPVGADVGSSQGAVALAKTTFDSFRRIDILVNNAGLLKEAPIGMISDDDVKAM